MPSSERPREKLLEFGANGLSNAELLAVILGSRTKAMPVMNLAMKLVNICDNNMSTLGKLSVEKLCKIKGVGPAKAISLQAAFELGFRAAVVQPVSEDILFITNNLQIIEGCHPPGHPVPDAGLRTFVPLPVRSKQLRLFDIGERSIILLAAGNFAKVRSYQYAENALAGEGPDRRI